MIDPAGGASPQIQQSVTNPVQKRAEDQQQQVRNNDQQSGNQIQKTSGNNESFKNELVQTASKTSDDNTPRHASRGRGSLLDITV